MIKYSQEKVSSSKQIDLSFKLTMDAGFHHVHALKLYQTSQGNFIPADTCTARAISVLVSERS